MPVKPYQDFEMISDVNTKRKYPNPFFDLASNYLPKNIKTLLLTLDSRFQTWELDPGCDFLHRVRNRGLLRLYYVEKQDSEVKNRRQKFKNTLNIVFKFRTIQNALAGEDRRPLKGMCTTGWGTCMRDSHDSLGPVCGRPPL